MKRSTFRIISWLAVISLPAIAIAQAQSVSTPSVAPQLLDRVPLTEVLENARKNSGKTFLVNAHAVSSVVIEQAMLSTVTYNTLLQILRNNDMAAVTVDGVVNIVPVATIRQYPLPTMPKNDSLHDEEWVTGVLKLENGPAAMMVPIMRPLMPQAGHLSANPPSNSVIIVDRLGNARRIFSMISQLDQATPAQSE